MFWFRFALNSLTVRQGLTGIAFVDSSKLLVCHNLRILRYQFFKGTVKRGKGTMR
ncbi:Mobile element protein [Candidatus Enterovibrio escicola]|uniref:Mobile element protein n=1 Tax=Candidatus Enterovibrio escicola TaxID=1927127 RepID=A0A2A5T4Y8_9GAMM|nr:Mobile element protein [Candidatus Enterovibrio escacola]